MPRGLSAAGMDGAARWKADSVGSVGSVGGRLERGSDVLYVSVTGGEGSCVSGSWSCFEEDFGCAREGNSCGTTRAADVKSAAAAIAETT